MQGIWVPGGLPVRVTDKEGGGKKFKQEVQAGYPNITPSVMSFFRDGKGKLATVHFMRLVSIFRTMTLFLVQLSSPGCSTGPDPKSKVRPMRFVNTPLPGYDPVEVVDLTRKYTQSVPKVLS
jgi:hypothetical protein